MSIEVHTPARPCRPYAKRWAALAVVLGAEAMDLLDASIMAVSAPTIRDDLGLGMSSVQWLVAGYSLAMAVGLITGGRLGDIFGRKRMFLVGVLGFVLASLLCASAPSEEVLIASRVLQGLAGAVMLPQGFGLIKEMFPPKELVKALAMFGPVMGASAVCGPILAGLLIDLDLFGSGWRTSFLITLPVGVLTLVAAVRLLPSGAAARETGRATTRPRLDLPGMLLAGGPRPPWWHRACSANAPTPAVCSSPSCSPGSSPGSPCSRNRRRAPGVSCPACSSSDSAWG